jgi:hypothetical protein
MEGFGTAGLRHEVERLVCAAFANRISLIHVGAPQMHQVPVMRILRRCTIPRKGFSLVPFRSDPENSRARAFYL